MALLRTHLILLLLLCAASCTEQTGTATSTCESGLSLDPATGLCTTFPTMLSASAAASHHVSYIRTQGTASLLYDPAWGRYMLGTGKEPSILDWTVPALRDPASTATPVLSLTEGGPDPYSLVVEILPGQLALLTGSPSQFTQRLLPKRLQPFVGAWHAWDSGGGVQVCAADPQGRLFWTQWVQGTFQDWTQVVLPDESDRIPVAPASLFALGGRLELAAAIRPTGLMVLHRGQKSPWEASALAMDDRVVALEAAGRGEDGVLAWYDCQSGALRFASAVDGELRTVTLDSQAIPADCTAPPVGGLGLLALPQSSTVLVAYYRAAQGTIRLYEVGPGTEPRQLSETSVPGPMEPAIGFTSGGRIVAAGVVTAPGASRGTFSAYQLY